MEQDKIRNFSIVAHVDHGKSTLADRLIERAGVLRDKDMRAQVLDSMDLERERGITIKAHAARIPYTGADGQVYQLNLIDTPGHVDFSYEVSRSLGACEGALLLVDAAQGVEAQTIANLYKALERDLEIIPILNKVDLPGAEVERVTHQIVELVGCDEQDVLRCSAKTGMGVSEIMEAIVRKIPSPKGKREAPLRALVIDSMFNTFRGVVVYVRIVDGELKVGDEIRCLGTERKYEVEELGYFQVRTIPTDRLEAGEVGYLMANVKELGEIELGDTITLARNGATELLPGYTPAKSMVYCGFYPMATSHFELLRDSLEKLRLNDASFHFEPESSAALGFGFRCGFLGMLHMEVIQERLEREFGQELVITAPNVVYQVILTDGEEKMVDNPTKLPPPQKIQEFREPIIDATIITPSEYVGAMMKLSMERRGIDKGMEYLDPTRVILHYEFPLSEVIFDFNDKIKSASSGYASFDYELKTYRDADLVKLDILVNGDPVDALSLICHREKAYNRGKQLAEKLREAIPRQMYEVAIQAAIGNKILARETVKAMRKNVTAKCYGGDITRKRKLLERQKEGKKRMKQVGSVEIPQEAFMAILNV